MTGNKWTFVLFWLVCILLIMRKNTGTKEISCVFFFFIFLRQQPFSKLFKAFILSNLSLFLFCDRALLQNLDNSNSSVCGEAAGESLSARSHSFCILIQNKDLSEQLQRNDDYHIIKQSPEPVGKFLFSPFIPAFKKLQTQ